MVAESLATPCLLYCGSCRYLIVGECRGCGSIDRQGCKIFDCCRIERGLRFCTECNSFPCETLKKSVGIHPQWLEELAKIRLKKK
ncbi:MAG: DUF3795 domain-containing protein [Candidatus Bathyarchaeia archaeon]